MAGLFKNNEAMGAFSPRVRLEQKFIAARSNLLLAMIFTVINMVLLISQSYMYFLFSASIPYLLIDLGMFLCGLYPAEFYGDLGFETFDISVLVVLTVVALLIVAVYLLCWILSKKHKIGWLVCALVMFVLDTVAMFLFTTVTVSSLLDIFFHFWVIYHLSMGIYACVKLQDLPPENEVEPSFEQYGEAEGGEETVTEQDNAIDAENSDE